MIQLVNTFKIELREAEVLSVRQFAEAMEPEVVEITLISKLFSDFSSRDIALGLTHRYSRFGQNHICRYVWMLPFRKYHVEYIWDISQLAQNEHLKVTAGTTGQQREELLTAFSKDVIAGRANKTLAFDPRSYGNEPSAASLPEEVLRLFLSRADGQYLFEAMITWQAGHMASW